MVIKAWFLACTGYSFSEEIFVYCQTESIGNMITDDKKIFSENETCFNLPLEEKCFGIPTKQPDQ